MSTLSDFLSAVQLGAGSVYHQVVQEVPKVTSWTADHPELKPLINDGVTLASSLLGGGAGGVGVPLATAVLSALKVLAAQDPTVQSGH